MPRTPSRPRHCRVGSVPGSSHGDGVILVWCSGRGSLKACHGLPCPSLWGNSSVPCPNAWRSLSPRTFFPDTPFSRLPSGRTCHWYGLLGGRAGETVPPSHCLCFCCDCEAATKVGVTPHWETRAWTDGGCLCISACPQLRCEVRLPYLSRERRLGFL